MSETVLCETKYTCAETLKEALGDLGIPPEQIFVHEIAQQLHGVNKINNFKANIIIKNGTNDIGFEKQENGAYKTIVSSQSLYSSSFAKRVLSKAMHGTGELDQFYAKRAVLKAIQKNYGHQLKTCEMKNGKIQMKVSVR
jgi:hypothetical protein